MRQRGITSGNDVDQGLPWCANLLFQTSAGLDLLYLSEQRNRRKWKKTPKLEGLKEPVNDKELPILFFEGNRQGRQGNTGLR